MNTEYVYLLGALAASSLAMAWFQSGLPIHVLQLAGWLFRWRKGDAAFWNGIEEDWELALTVAYPNLLTELLTCPVCLSFHISFWIGVVSLFVAPLPLWYPIVTAVTWPILINIFLTKTKHA